MKLLVILLQFLAAIWDILPPEFKTVEKRQPVGALESARRPSSESWVD
jgi:hypothetical protein